ncbi:MAG TPA: cystathionine gamma-synthase [Pirellulaceae bacterium]|nr:cystathionine gamma-synthase [Pirellulaceae bacterium]HMP70626.1 cystathionine gamma-synthase [Pirellulaceae bacterium]
MKLATKVIHAGQKPEPVTGAIMPPVFLTSTYVQEAPAQHKGYEYSRSGNPTRAALETNIAALEGAEYGLCFASGLAAENTVLHLLKSGDHIVTARDVYGGTFRLFDKVWKQLGITFTAVNAYNLDEIRAAFRPETKLLWLESPSNPLLSIVDLAGATELAKSRNAITVVDNTFATPILQQPLELGADIALHSTTKYLGGHSDVIGGALAVRDGELYERLKFLQNAAGGVPGPFDCYLVLRGIKTLDVRMQRHCENALKIAEFLAEHEDVERVYYPGLPSDPNYALAKRQMRGFGGMVSLELRGDLQRNRRFASSTELFALAESLGGVESMINHPASMTHASIPKEEREKGGLRDTLMRLSVGIESVDDLIADLQHAINVSSPMRV